MRPAGWTQSGLSGVDSEWAELAVVDPERLDQHVAGSALGHPPPGVRAIGRRNRETSGQTGQQGSTSTVDATPTATEWLEVWRSQRRSVAAIEGILSVTFFLHPCVAPAESDADFVQSRFQCAVECEIRGGQRVGQLPDSACAKNN